MKLGSEPEAPLRGTVAEVFAEWTRNPHAVADDDFGVRLIDKPSVNAKQQMLAAVVAAMAEGWRGGQLPH